MGKFASAARVFDLDKRGDGRCVAGEWISENLDDEDLVEFVRLANGHQWQRILRLSDHKLKEKSLQRHVHGTCPCLAGVAGRGCCDSCAEEETQ